MTEDSYATAPSASTPYGIERHKHLFAAWAASRAASVKGCRFSVEQGRAILEACDFTSEFAAPEQLPPPEGTNHEHRRWRHAAIGAAELHALTFTHGVAAKLINIYLKSRFVCGGHHSHKRVRALHPPIDNVVLRALARSDFGGFGRDWRSARSTRWSRLNSDQYEKVIELIRISVKDAPLWMIEQFWRGNQ